MGSYCLCSTGFSWSRGHTQYFTTVMCSENQPKAGIMRVDSMVNRAEGPKFFGVEVRGRREAGSELTSWAQILDEKIINTRRLH